MGLRKLLVDFLFLVFCSTESSGRLPLHFPLWKVPASAGSSLSRVLSFSLSLCCILLCLAKEMMETLKWVQGMRLEYAASQPAQPRSLSWLSGCSKHSLAGGQEREECKRAKKLLPQQPLPS